MVVCTLPLLSSCAPLVFRPLATSIQPPNPLSKNNQPECRQDPANLSKNRGWNFFDSADLEAAMDNSYQVHHTIHTHAFASISGQCCCCPCVCICGWTHFWAARARRFGGRAHTYTNNRRLTATTSRHTHPFREKQNMEKRLRGNAAAELAK